MKASSVLATLNEHGVEYVVVGPSAALFHQGKARAARPLNLCYRQTWSNCECLNRALEQLGARLLPPGSAPIPAIVELRQASEPVRFRSNAGPIQFVPSVPELGLYDDLEPGGVWLEADGVRVRALSLEQIQRWLGKSLRASEDSPLDLLLSLWELRSRQRGREHDSRS